MASILKGQSGQPIQFETTPNVNGDDVLTRPEIVGTVSQSGGVPTGAIIERGRNVNGEYVKYADGTQICFHTLNAASAVNIASGNIFRTNSGLWTYPVSFAVTPTVLVNVVSGVTECWAGFGASGAIASTTTFQAFRSSISNLVPIVTLSAIGRWF